MADPGRAYRALQGEIDAAVARVLRSGWYVLGQEVAAFEREFAAYLGARHVVAVNSGTDALRIALMACGVGPGDEVITAANAGSPTPMAITSLGAVPRFVDVDPATHTICPGAVEVAIGPRTRALLPIHLYGQPADLAGLADLARGHGLRLVEDACQAHGARFHGRMAGTVGDLGCFSFYPTKNLGALGDGGAVATDDEGLAQAMRLARQYGWQPRDQSVAMGINSRLDEVQAAILRAKLPWLEAGNVRRRQIAALYHARFASLAERGELGLPLEAAGRRHVYHLYVVTTTRRDALRAHLAARGIATGAHYPFPAHLHPAFRALWPQPPSLSATERLAQQVVSLPLFPEMTDDEAERVAAAVLEFFD